MAFPCLTVAVVKTVNYNGRILLQHCITVIVAEVVVVVVVVVVDVDVVIVDVMLCGTPSSPWSSLCKSS